MTLVRRPDWRARLIDLVERNRGVPFAWGRWDCALFTAAAVEAMTGEDLARGWRGYRSMKAGRAKLAAAGHADQVALAAALLPEIPPARALPGDVVAVPADEFGGVALGILQGRMVQVVGRRGLGLVSRDVVLRAFQVGER